MATSHRITLCIMSLGGCLLTEAETSKPNALIVIRHAQDKDGDWIWGERKRALPSGEDIKYYLKGLSYEGEVAAKSYAEVLPKLVSDLGIADVGRVIAKDPRPDGATPNPFDTIYPFIARTGVKDVRLPSEAAAAKGDVFPNDATGSIVVSFDVEGLWSPKQSDGSRTRQPDSNSLLHFLNDKYNIDGDMAGPPRKGKTMYVYRGKGKMEVYTMHQDTDATNSYYRAGF